MRVKCYFSHFVEIAVHLVFAVHKCGFAVSLHIESRCSLRRQLTASLILDCLDVLRRVLHILCSISILFMCFSLKVTWCFCVLYADALIECIF